MKFWGAACDEGWSTYNEMNEGSISIVPFAMYIGDALNPVVLYMVFLYQWNFGTFFQKFIKKIVDHGWSTSTRENNFPSKFIEILKLTQNGNVAYCRKILISHIVISLSLGVSKSLSRELWFFLNDSTWRIDFLYLIFYLLIEKCYN